MIRKNKAIYKTIIIIVFFIFILPFNAFSDYKISLLWDSTNPEPSGYRLYGREEGYSYDYDEFWCQSDSPDTQCTIGQLDENTTYFFVVRAFDEDGNESTNSNEVSYRYQGTEAIDDSSEQSGSHSGGSSRSGLAGCFVNTLIGR